MKTNLFTLDVSQYTRIGNAVEWRNFVGRKRLKDARRVYLEPPSYPCLISRVTPENDDPFWYVPDFHIITEWDLWQLNFKMQRTGP